MMELAWLHVQRAADTCRRVESITAYRMKFNKGKDNIVFVAYHDQTSLPTVQPYLSFLPAFFTQKNRWSSILITSK
jgi:predicted DNA-binding protein (MmcQ/YjbR family)